VQKITAERANLHKLFQAQWGCTVLNKKKCTLFAEFICRLQTSCGFHHIQCL